MKRWANNDISDEKFLADLQLHNKSIDYPSVKYILKDVTYQFWSQINENDSSSYREKINDEWRYYGYVEQ